MHVAGDWITDDIRDPQYGDARREAQRQQDVERAQLYRAAFVESPAGRTLLAAWDQDIANLRVSMNATLSEYVAAESYRNFVRKIHDQIKLATTEGR